MRCTVSLLLAAAFLVAGCDNGGTTVRGPAGQTLTLRTPQTFVIQRGTTKPLVVDLDREGFSGPVRVAIMDLPQGVRARETAQRVETTGATFLIRADRDAALVSSHRVRISAQGPGGMEAIREISMNVTD